jgi:integrase
MARPRSDGKPPRTVRKETLTEIGIQKIKLADRPFLLWDRKQGGLALSVQPSGHKAFKCIYSHHGKPRWYHLGNVGDIGLAHARTLAREVQYRVSQGHDPQAERAAEKVAGTFADLHQQYLALAKTKNKSWRQGEWLVTRYALPVLGKLKPNDIARKDVRQLVEKVAAPVLANQVLAAVSAVFNWALKREVVEANPCLKIDRNPVRPRERVLALENEIADFWAAFSRHGVAGATLKFILLTCQRPGEVCFMRREHIKNGWWEMPGKPDPKLGWPGVKNGADHKVWLSSTARSILAEMTLNNETTGFVFSEVRGKAKRKLDGDMRAICHELGITNKVTPHDLRRTASTIIQELGLDLNVLDKVMNHAEPKRIRRHYNQYHYEREVQHMMEALGARVLALAEGKQQLAGNVVAIR